MYHQVAIWHEDQQCQRFFWLDRSGELSVYVLQVMSFGACCSPSCAQYIKNLNAERFKATHQSAVEAITKRHYVDDMLVSVDEESEAIRLAEEVRHGHSQGGFEIRNWISNSKRVLTALKEKTTVEKDLDISPEVAMEKVLGMWWRTETDEFMFKIGWKRYDQLLLSGHRSPTKREMLRVLMTIFDPIDRSAELRPHLLLHRTVSISAGINYELICVSKFSKWKLLRNCVALVFRYISNLRLKIKEHPILIGPLSADELNKAEEYLFRLAQHEGFPNEVANLETTKSLPKTSPLYQLNPQLDEQGVIRMRTRIGACQFATEAAKKPIILPRDHHITTLIMKHYHHRYHHCNHETVINELRQRFHIPRIRVGFAKARRNCQRCKNETAMPRPPIMADLPPARLAAFTRPFTYVGIDYFGPIEVALGRRVEKRWGMLITCLTIRAIHIELVCTLSTNSCIMGLRNFVARRGTPRKIYSDRGTNFVGASRTLKEAMAAINEKQFMEEFITSETDWIFNPPAAPHMGGCWERLIRTVKANLMAIQSSRQPTDEVLRNVLIEIESIVNSRPLTHVPIDSDSAPALTPNHFLLGSSDGSKPSDDPILDNSGSALLQNWRTSQIIANQFWRRWVTDYLPEITRRTKWFVHTKPIVIGDVVIIVDPQLPRNW
ncbi:uncharacterized protein LOC129766532 [Toxorhynchites rutilus septentrionalis]|uniref:uncharacterized protein LOC129766532 n=1 Tax=Toxorhynchites rutilus septentrionalis TaxID=329112 RepID=UPI0024793824|nr:uncharacterized protein LOC129766532 [Toxorhynchites rutilus septentrionalis]